MNIDLIKLMNARFYILALHFLIDGNFLVDLLDIVNRNLLDAYQQLVVLFSCQEDLAVLEFMHFIHYWSKFILYDMLEDDRLIYYVFLLFGLIRSRNKGFGNYSILVIEIE